MDEFGPLLVVGIILLAVAALVAIWFLSIRFLRRLPPMLPLPVQTFYAYCTYFTIGIALIGTRASFLVPFGIVLTVLGLSIFLPERAALRCLGVFVLGSGIALLYLFDQFREGTPAYKPQKLSVWLAGLLIVLWGGCMLFAWQRWFSVRGEKPQEVPPRIKPPRSP